MRKIESRRHRNATSLALPAAPHDYIGGASGAMPTCRWASCPSISRSSAFRPSINAGTVQLGLAFFLSHVAQRVQGAAGWPGDAPAAIAASEEAAIAGRCAAVRESFAPTRAAVRAAPAAARESVGSRPRGAAESPPGCSGGRLRKRWLLRRNCSWRRGGIS